MSSIFLSKYRKVSQGQTGMSQFERSLRLATTVRCHGLIRRRTCVEQAEVRHNIELSDSKNVRSLLAVADARPKCDFGRGSSAALRIPVKVDCNCHQMLEEEQEKYTRNILIPMQPYCRSRRLCVHGPSCLCEVTLCHDCMRQGQHP